MFEKNPTELGNIYFKYNRSSGDFTKIRIMKLLDIKNGVVLYRDMKTKKKREARLKDIKSEYKLLASNLILQLTNAIAFTTDGGRDVKDFIALAYEREDSNEIIETPIVVCRQSMTDPVFEMFNVDQSYSGIVGVSLVTDNLPCDFTADDLMYADKVYDGMLLNMYKTDTLDDILELIGEDQMKLYNDNLSEIFEDAKNNSFINLVDDVDKQVYGMGYCKSVEQLFYKNNFMLDLYSALNIVKLDYPIDYQDDTEIRKQPNGLSVSMMNILEAVYGGIQIADAMYMEYDFDFDESSAKMPYLLVMDKHNKLYIVAYIRSLKDEVVVSPIVLENKNEKRVMEMLRNAVTYYDKYSEINKG